MKTTKMMMSMMMAAMMSMTITMTASAASTNHPRQGMTQLSGRNSYTAMHRPAPKMDKECECKACKKIRKSFDKHFKKMHKKEANRMTCRKCMEYSHKMKHMH